MCNVWWIELLPCVWCLLFRTRCRVGPRICLSNPEIQHPNRANSLETLNQMSNAFKKMANSVTVQNVGIQQFPKWGKCIIGLHWRIKHPRSFTVMVCIDWMHPNIQSPSINRTAKFAIPWATTVYRWIGVLYFQVETASAYRPDAGAFLWFRRRERSVTSRSTQPCIPPG